MYIRLRPFFNSSARTWCDINVTREMYDVNNVITTTSSSAKKYVYTIKLKKRITGLSFTTATVYPVSLGASKVSIAKPTDTSLGGVQSSAPLSGNYVVKCTDKNGVVNVSPAINYNQWDEGIRVQFMQSFQYLRGRVRVYQNWIGDESTAWNFAYRENGLNFVVIFEGFNENPPLCTLASDTVTPLTGVNVQFKSEVLRPFGQSLMFEPVGLEFLYSDAQSP